MALSPDEIKQNSRIEMGILNVTTHLKMIKIVVENHFNDLNFFLSIRSVVKWFQLHNMYFILSIFLC